MMDVHILWSRNVPRPWWAAHERLGLSSDERLFTDCCSCWMRADECESRIEMVEIPLGSDLGDYQLGTDWDGKRIGFYIPYEETRWAIRCGHGFGCSANPKRRRGQYLREISHYGI